MTKQNEQIEAALKQIRDKIDSLDSNLITMLNDRAKLAEEVAKVKLAAAHSEEEAQAIPFYRPEREAQVLRRAMKKNNGPLGDDTIAHIVREVMSACLALERPQTVAFLGPQGTFTQAAAKKHFGHGAICQPYLSIAEVFNQVESGHCHYGVVPVENTTEGMVTHTLDSFLNSSLHICGEVGLPIHLHLLTSAKTGKNIKSICAHQQALAQARNYLDKNYSEIPLKAVSSNGMGAKMAAEEEGVACVAGSMAAELYDLTMLAENIEDRDNNTTRFLIIGRDEIPPSGADKTSIIVSTRNESGALYHLLKPFYDSRINLTRLDTRPSKTENWAYVFFMEFEGHKDDDNIQAVLNTLAEQSVSLKVLGSYPRAVF